MPHKSAQAATAGRRRRRAQLLAKPLVEAVAVAVGRAARADRAIVAAHSAIVLAVRGAGAGGARQRERRCTRAAKS